MDGSMSQKHSGSMGLEEDVCHIYRTLGLRRNREKSSITKLKDGWTPRALPRLSGWPSTIRM